MSEVEAIEARIRALPPRDFAALRDWFHDFEQELWDQKIAADFRAGRFDRMIARARAEFSQGQAREL